MILVTITVLVLLALILLIMPTGRRGRLADSFLHNPSAEPSTRAEGAGRRNRDVSATGENVAGSRGGLLLRQVRRHRRNVAAEAAEWVVWMRQLAALLQVGRTPSSAFEVAAESLAESPDPTPTGRRLEDVCRTVARGATVGRAPSQTMRKLAADPSSDNRRLRRVERGALADLARCWEVSERTGAPLAALLEGLAEATEADLDAAAARETALAGSRATVRILTWLPVLALGLGYLIGADPLRTLLATPWGIGAGLVGAVLTVIGRLWTGRMVRRAEGAAHTSPGEPARRRAPRSSAEPRLVRREVTA